MPQSSAAKSRRDNAGEHFREAMAKPDQLLKFLAAIIQSSEDAIISKSIDGIITSWNPAAERILGYSGAEAVGQPISIIIPGERMGEEEEIIRRVLSGERIRDFETVRRKKDGTEIDVSLAISPIRDDSGAVVGASKILRDVTRLKRSEVAAARQAKLLDQADEAILVRDSNDCILHWNNGAERLYGWTAAEALGQVSHELLQTVFPEPLANIRRALEQDGHWRGELIQTARTGARLSVRTHWVRESASGEPHILETNFDLTEYKRLLASETRAVQQVRAERRFRTLLEAAPDGIFETDEQGRIVLVNPVAEKMFGYHREELLGQSIDMLVPTERRELHARERESYMQKPAVRGMGIGLELQGQRKDGTRFPVEISLSPLPTESGMHVAAVVRDISARKEAEARLYALEQKYRADLAEKNRQLEARNIELDRANRAKSNFLAGMSHELRTPLHTIIGFSELLTAQAPGVINEQQLRFLNHIHRDAEHLLRLINDILDVSKIESGRLELNIGPMDLLACIRESIAGLLPQAEAKSIRLECRARPSILVNADALRLKQILYNLVGNVIKFTPPNGCVWVDARCDDHAAEVEVGDTGVGIRPEEQEKIFDSFYQAKSVAAGTGLGLAITKHLLELHGGGIRVESTPGAGSVFRFTLPCCPS